MALAWLPASLTNRWAAIVAAAVTLGFAACVRNFACTGRHSGRHFAQGSAGNSASGNSAWHARDTGYYQCTMTEMHPVGSRPGQHPEWFRHELISDRCIAPVVTKV